MTTFSSAPPFSMEFLQPEDSMELASSPHIPQDDLDLDIDPMNNPDPAFEDSMVEDAATDDGQSEAIEHFDDDEMVDEDNTEHSFPDNVSDLNMEQYQEHAENGEDEDILYEDEELPEYQETNQHNEVPAEAHAEYHQPPDSTKPAADDVEVAKEHPEEDFDLSDPADPTQPITLSEPLPAATLVEASEPAEADHTAFIETPDTHEQVDETEDANHSQQQAQRTVIQDTPKVPDSGLDYKDRTSNTNPLDTIEASDPKITDQNAAETDIHTSQDGPTDQQYELVEVPNVALHTIKVIYQDNEICLFRPQNDDGTETFFLSESSLAHESLETLLASCRDVLADTIGDDDELVLDVASLGLHISEGSKYAAEITLSQILDVYLKLSHNENMEYIEPLYCNLSSRVCLASQYAYLTAAAQEGKTITEITLEHSESPEMEPLEHQQSFVEEHVEDEAVYHESTEAALTAQEQTVASHAEHDDVAPDAEATEHVVIRADEPLEQTETTDNRAAENVEEYDGIPKLFQSEDTEAPVPSTTHADDTVHDDDGIQPSNTEYQEDIDDMVNQDEDQLLQEDEQPDEDDFATHDTNDENISSGTVEAEIEGKPEEYFDDMNNFDELHAEPTALDENNTAAPAEVEASDQEPSRSMQSHGIGDDPVHFEEADADDLLDLGPEDQEQPPRLEANSATTEDEDFDDNEDLIAEADASTDKTLDHAQEDQDEDDLDVFVPPATPRMTRSSKRKAEVDDEDDFGLLDIETPDKKRRRPS